MPAQLGFFVKHKVLFLLFLIVIIAVIIIITILSGQKNPLNPTSSIASPNPFDQPPPEVLTSTNKTGTGQIVEINPNSLTFSISGTTKTYTLDQNMIVSEASGTSRTASQSGMYVVSVKSIDDLKPGTRASLTLNKDSSKVLQVSIIP